MRSEVAFQINSRAAAPGVEVQLRTYRSEPSTGTICVYDSNVVGWVMSGAPDVGVRDERRSPFVNMGRVVFQPRAVPWEFDNPGGLTNAIVCLFDDEMWDVAVPQHGRGKAPICSAFDLRSPPIFQLLRLMETEVRSPGFASTGIIESLTMTMLRYLCRVPPALDALGPGRYRLAPAQLRRIDERLEDLSGGPPSVSELAALCGSSTAHLLRRFRETTGMSPSAYIFQVQLQKARWLLSGTNLPIKQVAHRTGFANPSHFANAFRRATGVSPRAFRREAAE